MKSLIAHTSNLPSGDSLDTHAFAPYFKTGVALMDTIDEDIEREHKEQQLPVVEYCTSIEFMNMTFNTDACPDELALGCAKPCIVVSLAYINKFVSNKEDACKDIASVLITSQKAGIGEYKFVEAICSGDWFGLRPSMKYSLISAECRRFAFVKSS